VKNEFGGKRNPVVSSCPACKSKKAKIVFSHFGFKYAECLSCGSVYINARFPDADIKNHYLESVSADFWRNTLSRKTEGKRKEKIYENRFQWFRDIAQNYLPCAATIADFNSKDPEYAREFLQNGYFKRKIVVNPYFNISALDNINAAAGSCSVIQELTAPLKSMKGMVDIACAFEVLDCFTDIDFFLKTVNALLCRGGLCFMTTISISGFDLQVLWENSTSIFPPDRINVLSRQGLELLFRRHGFDIVEYSTPGFLDLEIVKNTVRKNLHIELPRFVRTILKNGDAQVHHDFQDFLQLSKLSSFVRIVLKKK
jgi:ribosomal protein S27E